MTAVNDLWQDRLFVKYAHSPEILGLVEMLSSPLQETMDVLEYILSNDELDNTVGEILDFKGELIGVNRPPAQEPDSNLLWLCEPGDAAEDLDGAQSLAAVDSSTGGYMTGLTGIYSQSDPGSYMSDDEYRELIRSKAATYREKATRTVIYDYLLEFGVRCRIIEGARSVEFEPHSYDALNYWVRNYIEQRGFKPAGIQASIKTQTVSDAEV